MSRASWASVDTTSSPPSVSFPRAYNLAADLVHRHVAEGRGSRIAVHDDTGRHSYAELAERVERVAGFLLGEGVAPEQRVLLCLLDSIDFVALFLGASQMGAVPVPVNTMLTPDDYAFLLRDSRAPIAFVSDSLASKLEGAAAPALKRLVRESELERLLSAATASTEVAPSSPDDVAFWLYSSGSTGAPKGAMHLGAHPRLTAALYAQGVLGMREDDVVYSAARLFFAYGLGNAMTFPLSVGATAALSAGRPTPKTVERTLHDRGATLFCGVPTLYASMLADASIERFETLRICISAGEALPREIGERWKARFGVDILDGIGSTEMLHIFISNAPDDIAYGTTGRPVPGYELRLESDDGAPVPAGEGGALWVRGPTSAIGYWNQRAKSLDTFHGPWTRTGDRYVRDEAGRYTYEGRADDMLKVGGIWVSPFEVESALMAHEHVLEAAVVGHSDESGLVKPRAYVVLRDAGAACEALSIELQLFVKTRLAPYKYPRSIEFVVDLPKTATGKIQRFRLRSAG